MWRDSIRAFLANMLFQSHDRTVIWQEQSESRKKGKCLQAIFTVVLGKAALVGEYQGFIVERVAPSWGSLPSSWNYGKYLHHVIMESTFTMWLWKEGSCRLLGSESPNVCNISWTGLELNNTTTKFISGVAWARSVCEFWPLVIFTAPENGGWGNQHTWELISAWNT